MKTDSLSLGVEMDGTMAEFMVLSEAGVAAAPSHLSDEEAASIPTAGVTAWRALVTEGRLKAGDTVLVQGTGGVSIRAAVREVAGCLRDRYLIQRQQAGEGPRARRR